MSNEVFTKHQHDPVPLHRNTMPVAECGVHSATVGGKPCKAIDVPILSCASVWLRVQKEAEAWITVDGKLIADPIQRNRQINKAYAQLWLADKRFQWAGLAAFASKQVGCGLLHSADNIKKSQEEMLKNHLRTDILNSSDGAAINVMPSSIGFGSAYMHEQLALGNTLLFLDIYPLHRFYMLRGFEHLKKCLQQRSTISDKVVWPIEEAKLPFGKFFNEIITGFAMVEGDEIARSVQFLAYHEQINILQTAMYEDFAMRRALDSNQFSWATNFPYSGVAAEVQLTLSAECQSRPGPATIWFSNKKTAKLYDQDQRMAFVYEAANRFDMLLHGSERAAVEKSIGDIAISGGTR
ncbi:DUF2515 family protein [Duganella sp. CT11-25]|uniref:DUF2515 family protein n=1 Tax=unclassified Duganella TaxID=2636909 RepID=UPI0039B09AC8